jgi:ABC-2 type transport system ATP-binding protein
MEEADYLYERVGIRDRGKIIALNTLKIFKKLDFVTEFRKHDDFVTLRMERGDLRIPVIMEVAKLAGIGIKSVNLRKLSLEDVFLHFTGRRIRE